MRRTRLALLASCIWVAAALAGASALAALGPRLLTVVDLIVLAGAACGATYALALAADRRERGTGSRAAPAETADGRRIEPIAVAPPARIELTAEHLGFAALSTTAMVVTADGTILATTRGLAVLAPDLGVGSNVDALFGCALADGLAGKALTIMGGERFRVTSQPAGARRLLLEFQPEAQPIADDDLEVFAEAVARGLTGFRFEAARARGAPALDMLNDVIAELDNVAAAIGGISAGTGAAREYLTRNGGLAPLLRVLDNDVRALASERDEEAALRFALEAKLMAVARAIDGYRIAAEYTARETRALAAESGTESAQGFAAPGALQNALGDLGRHLRNLSDEQGMMVPIQAGQDRAAA